MIPGLQLHAKRLIALHHAGKNFLRGLNQALGPASLLGLERGHFDRQLGRTFDILQVNKFPSLELRPVRQVGIFGQSVVLPAAGFLDRAAPPHSRCAVEIEEDATARPSGMLQNEVPVQQNGFDLGQK